VTHPSNRVHVTVTPIPLLPPTANITPFHGQSGRACRSCSNAGAFANNANNDDNDNVDDLGTTRCNENWLKKIGTRGYHQNVIVFSTHVM
jgi:hypothetical protein